LNVYRAMPVNADNAKPTDNRAIVATDLTKWFGEGETRKVAVNGVALVAHFPSVTMPPTPTTPSLRFCSADIGGGRRSFARPKWWLMT
jgi:hypothetical protein